LAAFISAANAFFAAATLPTFAHGIATILHNRPSQFDR
jgi:hypothetical protein